MPGLAVRAVIDGIAVFRRGFAGRILLEIFIVPGIGGRPEELAALKQAATFIAPDAIQLNSRDRPAPGAGVKVAGPEGLLAIGELFRPLPVQLVRRRGEAKAAPWSGPLVRHEVPRIIETAPASLARLSLLTGIRAGDMAKIMAGMAEDGLAHVSPFDAAVWQRR